MKENKGILDAFVHRMLVVRLYAEDTLGLQDSTLLSLCQGHTAVLIDSSTISTLREHSANATMPGHIHQKQNVPIELLTTMQSRPSPNFHRNYFLNLKRILKMVNNA